MKTIPFTIFLCLSGCSGDKNGDTAEEDPQLIDMTKWSLAYDSDHMSEHQPEEIDCGPNAFLIELEQLEIRTDFCNYAVVEFLTQHELKKGETVEAMVLHTGLWSQIDSVAHFAIFIEGQLFWEENPPIPSETEFFFGEGLLNSDYPIGSRIQLHLHNHGINDWRFGYFRKKEE